MCGLDPLLFGENFCACDYPPVCGHLPEGVPTLCLCPLPFLPSIFWPLCAACGIEYKPPAVEACSLNHWIAREVLPILFWFLHCIFSCENIFCCIQVILIDSCSSNSCNFTVLIREAEFRVFLFHQLEHTLPLQGHFQSSALICKARTTYMQFIFICFSI